MFNIPNSNESSKLMTACAEGEFEAVTHILVDLKKQAQKWLDTNITKLFSSWEVVYKKYLDERNKEGYCAVHAAVLSGNLEILGLLFVVGANFNAQNNQDYTALHMAVKGKFVGHSGEIVEIPQGSRRIVRSLLKYGADPNVQGENKRTPLHIAVYEDNIEAFEELMEYHICINTQNNDGSTPLHEAAFKNRHEMARILVERGADHKLKDNADHTPLHTAIYEGHSNIVRLLLDCGAAEIMDTNQREAVKQLKELIEFALKCQGRGVEPTPVIKELAIHPFTRIIFQRLVSLNPDFNSLFESFPQVPEHDDKLAYMRITELAIKKEEDKVVRTGEQLAGPMTTAVAEPSKLLVPIPPEPPCAPSTKNTSSEALLAIRREEDKLVQSGEQIAGPTTTAVAEPSKPSVPLPSEIPCNSSAKNVISLEALQAQRLKLTKPKPISSSTKNAESPQEKNPSSQEELMKREMSKRRKQIEGTIEALNKQAESDDKSDFDDDEFNDKGKGPAAPGLGHQ